MRRRFATLAGVFVVATLVAAAPASAQVERGRVPDTGMTGIGFTMSAAIPTDGTLQTGPELAIKGERYVTPRVSVRGLFSGAWMDVTGHSFTGTVRPIKAIGNLVYNWEGGQVHPYVTAGGGLYHFRFTDNGINGSDNKFGVNFGGGLEWFISRRDSITGEVGYHAIPGQVTSPLTHYNPSFWTIAGGYKKYF